MTGRTFAILKGKRSAFRRKKILTGNPLIPYDIYNAKLICQILTERVVIGFSEADVNETSGIPVESDALGLGLNDESSNFPALDSTFSTSKPTVSSAH